MDEQKIDKHSLATEIKAKQIELHALEERYFKSMDIESAAAHKLSHNIYYTKYSSLVVLLGSLILLCLVLFSGLFVELDQSSKTLGLSGATKRVDCSSYNGNYGACVQAQSRNMGCAWLATCSKCIAETDDASAMCK